MDQQFYSLNKESTVTQLLGNHYFFSKDKHKKFYIKKICEILAISNSEDILNDIKTLKKDKTLEFKKKLEKNSKKIIILLSKKN